MSNTPMQEESSEGEVFHVEVITKARVNEEEEWEYYVKWAGYGSDADSWEPSENVHSCDRLLRSFWNHVGTDNNDYEVGYVVEAQPDWIAREREFFAKRIKAQNKNKGKKKRTKHKGFKISSSDINTQPKKKDKTQELISFVEALNSGDESGESEDTPLSQKQAKAQKQAKSKKGKSAKKPKVKPGSDTDDSMPLSKSVSRSASGSGLKRKASVVTDDASAGPSKSVSTAQPPRKVSKTVAKKDAAPTLKLDTSAASLKGKGKEKACETPTTQLPASAASSPTSLFSANDSSPRAAASSSKTDAAGKAQKSSRYPPIKVKLMEAQFTDTSALGTKRRLAVGDTASKPVEELFRKTPALNALKFTKNKDLPKAAASPELASPHNALPPPTDGISRRTQTAPKTQPFSAPTVQNTAGRAADDGYHPDDELHSENTWEEPPPQAPIATGVNSTANAEVDQFLSSIMPPALAAPIQDGVEAPSSNTYQPAVKPKPKLPMGKIPKKYRWTGDMFYNTNDEHAERLCTITITEPVELVPNGIRFSICVSPRDSLRFEKLLPISALRLLRLAWGPVTEVAKLAPNADQDKEPFEALLKYMTGKQLIAFARMTLDDKPVATLLIFPSANQAFCEEFNVSESSRTAGTFVAALVPWLLPGAKLRKLGVQPSDEADGVVLQPPNLAQPPDFARRVRFNPGYMRALQTLQFPAWLHEYLSSNSRPFSVWSMMPRTRRDGKPVVERLETKALIEVLSRCGNREVEIDKSTRLVFVHVGAMKTLHMMGSFVERCQTSLIQFFTYGTHETVPPERWGVREIFPLGGIVTFTWNAYMENPIALDQLISMVEDHPLWSCYVTPSVIAMLVRECCGSDPYSAFESANFPFDTLFSMIEMGHLSLLSMPPLGRSSDRVIVDWVSSQAKLLRSSPRDILQYCLKHFMDRYVDMHEERWPSLVLEEVAAISSSLRQQPSMMDSYRRFVVIRGSGQKDALAKSSKIDFEYVPLEKFDFLDGFYDANDMNAFKSIHVGM